MNGAKAREQRRAIPDLAVASANTAVSKTNRVTYVDLEGGRQIAVAASEEDVAKLMIMTMQEGRPIIQFPTITGAYYAMTFHVVGFSAAKSAISADGR